MRTLRIITRVALLLLVASEAWADYVEVRRLAPMRQDASTSSVIVFRPDVGTNLPLVSSEQTNGYYHVRHVETGTVGFIYRSFVRRYAGPLNEESDGSATSSDSESGTSLLSLQGAHAFAGYPTSVSARTSELLESTGYAVGYSETLKVPLWAAYRCTWVENAHSPGKRPKRFKIDERTSARVSHDDYAQSDYFTNPNSFDRGHMAPNFAIGSRYGREAQLQTFVMSNICPQRSTLNQQTWEALEKQIANVYSFECDEVWVLVGPIIGDNPMRLNGEAAIPDAFYAIIVDVDDSDLRTLSVILDQSVKGIQSLRKYVVTIDSVETVTGLDFFSELPDALENQMERESPDEFWRIDELLIPSLFAGGN